MEVSPMYSPTKERYPMSTILLDAPFLYLQYLIYLC